MPALIEAFRKNRALFITLAILAVLFLLAVQGMRPEEWIVTVLRGLAVGAVIFLAAAGLSLIFGLMDVLNLAHGTLFMLGAYVAWTAYVRPDTVLDVLTPLALLAAGLATRPAWAAAISRLRWPAPLARLGPWVLLAVAAAVTLAAFAHYPIAIWNLDIYEQSPIVFAMALDQGQLQMPAAVRPEGLAAVLAFGGLLLGGAGLAAGLASVDHQRSGAPGGRLRARAFTAPIILALLGLGLYLFNDVLTAALFAVSTNWRFLFAIGVAVAMGLSLGGAMESTLIRPLYARPMYQLMLTLGLGAIGREVVIAVWGRTQITMPKPALFNGSGDGCPAATLTDWLAYQCTTFSFMGTRIRVYNEIFLILVGLLVLVVVWLLIQRSRLGMIIRAGVQDRQMVEALGINVRQVFTLIFSLGVGLAALGGALNGPSVGVSEAMGEALLLQALIALAIGGLTSFPGAAAGSVLVGLLQQFIIKYGQIGISLPLLAEPFKPTPPLVPASTVLLMVIILLVLPQGLLGRKE